MLVNQQLKSRVILASGPIFLSTSNAKCLSRTIMQYLEQGYCAPHYSSKTGKIFIE